jgi:hypothetical protein
MSRDPADVEDRAEAAGYRLAQRSLRGQLVSWWQLIADPDPSWAVRSWASLSWLWAVP